MNGEFDKWHISSILSACLTYKICSSTAIVICRPVWRSPTGRQIGTSEYLTPNFGRQITYMGVFAAQTKDRRPGPGWVVWITLSLAVGEGRVHATQPLSFFSYPFIATLSKSETQHLRVHISLLEVVWIPPSSWLSLDHTKTFCNPIPTKWQIPLGEGRMQTRSPSTHPISLLIWSVNT